MSDELVSEVEWARWREKLSRAAPTFDISRSVSEGISKMFGGFCDTSGIVLDVGSGPSKAPYLRSAKCKLCVGVDPLPVKARHFELVCAVGEFLPFRSDTFDRCICATSLDHCVRPQIVLNEMGRVLSPQGKIFLWIGIFDRPKSKIPLKIRWKTATTKTMNLLGKGEFLYITRAAWIKILKRIDGTSTRTKITLGLHSDPWHLHCFKEKRIQEMLKQLQLHATRRRLDRNHLFLEVRKR